MRIIPCQWNNDNNSFCVGCQIGSLQKVTVSIRGYGRSVWNRGLAMHAWPMGEIWQTYCYCINPTVTVHYLLRSFPTLLKGRWSIAGAILKRPDNNSYAGQFYQSDIVDDIVYYYNYCYYLLVSISALYSILSQRFKPLYNYRNPFVVHWRKLIDNIL